MPPEPLPSPYTDTALPAAGVRRLLPHAPLTLVKPDHNRSTAPAPDALAAWVRAVALQADRAAFTRLFEHFAPRIKSYLMRGGADEALADELVQDTMVALWRKSAQFDDRQAGVATWVFTIARNLRVDRFRRQGGELLADEGFDADALVHGGAPLDEQLHTARLEQQVRAAINCLPPEQAQVLRLSYFEDEPHARIASALGLPLGTVKSRVRLAVAHLRRLLGPEVGAGAPNKDDE